MGSARPWPAAARARRARRAAGSNPSCSRGSPTRCGAPWWHCDVTDRGAVDAAVDAAAEALGGLDVVVANAGIAAQLPLVGGDPRIMERRIAVNVLGTYYTLRAAGAAHRPPRRVRGGRRVARRRGPRAAARRLQRVEGGGRGAGQHAATGAAAHRARVGVAYFAELDTDMTTRGFDTEAAGRCSPAAATITGVTPLEVGIDALERGIARRSRHDRGRRWVAAGAAGPHDRTAGRRRGRPVAGRRGR